MNLYIRLKDGQPFEHPILEENLLQAFPSIDLNNLPDDIVRFEKIESPKPGVYERLLPVEYVMEDGVVKEHWTVQSFTEEEKQAKMDFVRYMRPHFSSWTFDETLCEWVPPVPRPEGLYVWSEKDQNWVTVPEKIV